MFDSVRNAGHGILPFPEGQRRSEPACQPIAMKQILAALVVVASLVGCATLPFGDAQQDAAGKAFSVAPDRAAIYVFRNETTFWAEKVDVYVDTAPLGRTVGKTYLVKQVMPGRHTITSSANNIVSANSIDTLEVNAEAGSITFVWLEMMFGWSVRAKLHLVGEAEGRKGVLESRLMQSRPVTQTVEVRVEADQADWRGPLDCQASNSLGSWPFIAPGTVVVETSTTELRITCQTPARTMAQGSNTAPDVNKATTTGALIGGGAMAAVGLGVAFVPLIGPPMALVFAAAMAPAAGFGAQIGSASNKIEYPSPITVLIERVPSLP